MISKYKMHLFEDIENDFQGAECILDGEKIELFGEKYEDFLNSECSTCSNRFWIINSENIWFILGSPCNDENDIDNVFFEDISGIGFRLDYSKELEDKIKDYVSET